MLKRLLTVVIFSLLLVIPLSVSQASHYPQHLYGNSALVLAYGHMGYGTYVDTSSVVNEYYNPPYYKLAANIINYNTDEGYEYSTETRHYEYNIDTGAIYEVAYGKNNQPMYDRSNNPSYLQRPINVAKIIWKTVYGMDWHY